MDKLPRISEAEMEVLRVLWAGGESMTVAEVAQHLPDRTWNYKTVGTFLVRLEEKGAVIGERAGRANRYRPALSEEEYQRRETEEFLRSVHHGSMRSLLSALCGPAPDEKTLDELERWLKEQ